MPEKIEITTKAILIFLAVVVMGWFIVKIEEILALLFISFILMSALKPTVDYIESKKISRIIAILLIYSLMFLIVTLFIIAVFPPLISESTQLIFQIPKYLSYLFPGIKFDIDLLVQEIQNNLNATLQQIIPFSQNVARVTIDVFLNLFKVFSILVACFYFLLDRNNLKQMLSGLVGSDIGETILRVLEKVEVRLGTWVRGELLLGVIIGLSSYLGLTLLGVNFALPLALVAGVLELVPIIGPIISAVPAVIVAFPDSPVLALKVVVLYIVIQQLENNFIVPAVMRKAVGLPSLAILLALMVGGRLGGTLGIILAVPVLLVLQTVIQEFLRSSTKSA